MKGSRVQQCEKEYEKKESSVSRRWNNITDVSRGGERKGVSIILSGLRDRPSVTSKGVKMFKTFFTII